MSVGVHSRPLTSRETGFWIWTFYIDVRSPSMATFPIIENFVYMRGGIFRFVRPRHLRMPEIVVLFTDVTAVVVDLELVVEVSALVPESHGVLVWLEVDVIGVPDHDCGHYVSEYLLAIALVVYGGCIKELGRGDHRVNPDLILTLMLLRDGAAA